jgi:hypothetical protein
MPEYIPGTCNIGPSEIRMRQTMAWVCLLVTIGLSAYLYLLPSREFRLIVFLPSFVTAVLFLQSVFSFCVHYGFQGVFNVQSSLGKTDTIEQAEFRQRDRLTAIRILASAAVIAMVFTTAFYLIP